MPEPLKLKDIKLRMQAYGIRPKKQFGQNILADFNLLKAIVADAEIGPGDLVLEIGTGAGSLTGFLCDAAGLVISVEVDTGMFEMARDILAGVDNLVQVNADALAAQGRGLNDELISLVRERLADDGDSAGDAVHCPGARSLCELLRGQSPTLKLVANLPYSVATSVLIAALESGLPFERMLVMVQYDVAEKLAAEPGGRHWGLPSLLRWCFADASIKRKVAAKVFWPKPKVESALLEIRPVGAAPRGGPPSSGRHTASGGHTGPPQQAYHKLRRLAHVMFQHRRKASANALALALGEANRRTSDWITQAGGDPAARPEQLHPTVLFALAANPEVEALVRRAMSLHEDQLSEKADKRARRAAWKRRVYGEEE
jgi:16S rRNA A1518/A1519 N6-dimethyltransferase RsmA/KsgA/DIM1 with predicted DNA glycosylase/AP lyase activity